MEEGYRYIKCPYRSMSGTGTGVLGVFSLVWVPSMDLYEHSEGRGGSSVQINQITQSLPSVKRKGLSKWRRDQ